jgi:peptidoglycan L-alanyl-D-glutamate endopeptidase CwlK
MSKLSKRSKLKLEGVHPDLVAVVERAAELGPDFIVTEGLRSLERQRELRRIGKSQTLNSRHLTGHAVDVCDLKAKYTLPEMRAIAASMKKAAADLNVPIAWGGDWKTFKDTPHFELCRKAYPAKGSPVKWKDRVKDAAAIAASARSVGGVVAGGSAVVVAENTPAVPAVTEAVPPVTEAVKTLPPPPTGWLDSLSNLGVWQTMGEQLWALKDFAFAQPLLSVGLGISLAVVWLWPAKKSAPAETLEAG